MTFEMADVVRVDGAGDLDGIYEFVNYIDSEPAYAYVTNDMCNSEIKVWIGTLLLVCRFDDRKDMGSIKDLQTDKEERVEKLNDVSSMPQIELMSDTIPVRLS